MKFTETQLIVISNALRVAAEQFALIANSHPELNAAFGRREKEALALYTDIETRTGISG